MPDLQDSINQRVRKFLNDKKISQKLFSEVTGYDDRSISNIVNDKTQYPKADFFQAFAIHYPEISLRWLLIGEGEMEVETESFPVVAREPAARNAYKAPKMENWDDVMLVVIELTKLAAVIPILVSKIEKLESEMTHK